MAESLFCLSITYLLLILFAKRRTRCKFTLVIQFFIGWIILELAAFHAAISAGTILMAVGDAGDWQWHSYLGLVISLINIWLLKDIHYKAAASKHVFKEALETGLGDNFKKDIIEERASKLSAESPSWYKPFSLKNDQYEHFSNVVYGPNDRNTLDLYKPKGGAYKPRPVILQIHGGGWMLGYSERQGLPLRNKLIEAGWIFVSINYRLSPKDAFPAHLIDCKQAVRWIKENISEYGGDPDFILATGGSAGGHLCSLVGLTANQHTDILQPGFEDADTSVKGCLPMYGVFDFLDRNKTREDMPMKDFLADKVMQCQPEDKPELWEIASPLAQVNDQAPPFMITHGQLDTLAFVEEAQYFAKAIRQQSKQACVYTELEETQHAFEIFYSPRCIHTVNAMHIFCEWVYSDYLKE
ncbi:MAG: alpha/beta hydrolase fold domain-containing protein [Sinobacterium sp.]|nr:alpha/beta hydrolase fold domain-containing protein [Sinobacterium sp.]